MTSDEVHSRLKAYRPVAADYFRACRELQKIDEAEHQALTEWVDAVLCAGAESRAARNAAIRVTQIQQEQEDAVARTMPLGVARSEARRELMDGLRALAFAVGQALP